jgi:hypothetical protein
MPEASDRRSKLRIIVGAEQTLRFVVKGHSFQNVRITNLSCDGCFATVQAGSAGLFAQGTILENLAFENPAMPQAPITAKVTYALGGPGGRGGLECLGLGIFFAMMSPETAAALNAFVEANRPFR